MADMRAPRRVHRKLDEYPPNVRDLVDRLLADPQMTYTDIAERLTEQGYEISKSAIHRYAAQVGADQQRLKEISEQTRRLVQALKDDQDVDATSVANALLLDALTRRIATAEEEFDALPVDKAGRLLVQLQRSAVYKARTMEDKRRVVGRVEEKILNRLREQVQGDDELAQRLSELVSQSAQEVLASED